MKANETKLQPLIEGTKQYLVPLFQRPYRWVKAHWRNLWMDLQDLQDEPDRSHFMGALVTMPAHTVPEGVNKYLLIDGQQRLTTIFIVLTAIRDRAKTLPGNLAAKIDDLFLTNKYQEGDELYKLLPTQLDRDAFISMIGEGGEGVCGPIGDAYSYFATKLASASKEQLDSLLALLIGRLVFVSIVLAHDDNPYLIFESLNAKGCPLTQADLIRNYCFMSIHSKKHLSTHEKYWRPMEDRLGGNMTEFIRHFLTRQGNAVKVSEIYNVVKEATIGFKEPEILEYLNRMKVFSDYYICLVDPTYESSASIRQRLHGLNRLDVTTAYPFLLNVYHEFRGGELPEEDFADILEILESYLVRRFVCGVPTHGLNKVFPGLYSNAKAFPALKDGVAAVLKDRNFPRNADFAESFASARLYGSGDRAAKTKYILERLEGALRHHEPVDFKDLTIEHILPRTLTPWWKSHLGDQWEECHERYLDTIGNLTLTGYNSDLSNHSFDKKREWYSSSHVELTRKVCSAQAWGRAQMEDRGALLAVQALEIWKYCVEPEEGGDASSSMERLADPAMAPAETARQLGGGSRIRSQFYALANGHRVLVANSKLHAKQRYYWYGISAAQLKAIDDLCITHVALGMGTKSIALVPTPEFKGFLKGTNTTRNPDGSVRHYHILVSHGGDPEMYWSESKPKLRLKPFLVECRAETLEGGDSNEPR